MILLFQFLFGGMILFHIICIWSIAMQILEEEQAIEDGYKLPSNSLPYFMQWGMLVFELLSLWVNVLAFTIILN